MKKIFFLLAIVTSITSCKKGDTGSTGPAGNANVHSYSFTVAPGDWQHQGTVNNNYEWFIDLPVPEITSALTTSGLVIINWDNSGVVETLPITYLNSGVITYYQPSIQVGEATVKVYTQDHQNIAFSQSNTFRVVIINESARIAHPEVNWNNPQAVANAVSIL